jgi:hypothetical protein
MDNVYMFVDSMGTKRYKNAFGLLHRLDGPAIEWTNGAKTWFKNGSRHRLGGPAVEGYDGAKIWYQEGKIHRSDGPAIISANGKKEWWLKDRLFKTKEDYFNYLSDEDKTKCLFSEDFLNG